MQLVIVCDPVFHAAAVACCPERPGARFLPSCRGSCRARRIARVETIVRLAEELIPKLISGETE